MPQPNHPPTHVYKILSAPPPSPLPTRLSTTSLDAKDGFVHLSTASQVPGTCARFFSDHRSICLLKVSLTRLTQTAGGEMRWEDAGSGGGPFAHLYGRALEAEDVEGIREYERVGEGRKWEEVLDGEDGWLV